MQQEKKDIEVATSPDKQSTELEKGEAPSEFNARSNLVLLGAWAAAFCSVGFVNAFGVFQEYYSSTLIPSKSSSSIAWIGSIQIFLMFGGTPVAGFLTDKYGPRLLICGASIGTLLAIFMTSLSKKYYQLILAQGILLGISMAFLLVPLMATVAYYFKKNRSFALGITISGSSIGGVLWPIALHRLFDDISFGWTVRIAGFIMLPLLGGACFFVRVPVNGNHQKPKVDLSCIKNPALLLLALGLFFYYLGLFSLLFYVTSYTISLGLDANMGFYMVSIANAASLFGRVLPGLLADRYGAFNIMIIFGTLSGVVCMCWTTAVTIAGIVVLSLAYGFASGAVVSLPSACAAQLVEPQQYGIAMGVVMGFFSIAGLIGTPINGQLLDAGGYLAVSLFSGLALLVGVVVVMFARLKVSTQILAKV